MKQIQRLGYDAGVLNENLLRQLILLDSIATGGNKDIRDSRKAQVKNVTAHMAEIDLFRSNLSGLSKLLERLRSAPDEEPHTNVRETSDGAKTEEQQQGEEPMVDQNDAGVHEEQPQTDDQYQEHADEDTGEEEEFDVSQIVNRRDLWAKHFDRVSPPCEQYQQGIGLVITLPGLYRPSLKIETSAKQRILTVYGVLQSSRGWCWFERAFTVPKQLSFRKAKSVLKGDNLVISFPEEPRQPQFSWPQTAREYSPCHSSKFDRGRPSLWDSAFAF